MPIAMPILLASLDTPLDEKDKDGIISSAISYEESSTGRGDGRETSKSDITIINDVEPIEGIGRNNVERSIDSIERSVFSRSGTPTQPYTQPRMSVGLKGTYGGVGVRDTDLLGGKTCV